MLAVDSSLWTWQFDLLCLPFVVVGLAWIVRKYRRDPDGFLRWFDPDE